MRKQVSTMPALAAELTVSAAGTIVGLLLGLAIDRRKRVAAEQRRDVQLVQALVDRLAGKRALSTTRHREGRFHGEDFARCSSSILDARERILSTAEGLARPEKTTIDALREMEKACMAYLSFAERDPGRYPQALHELSGQLFLHEKQLASVMSTVKPKLQVEHPGSRDDAVPPEWLKKFEQATSVTSTGMAK